MVILQLKKYCIKTIPNDSKEGNIFRLELSRLQTHRLRLSGRLINYQGFALTVKVLTIKSRGKINKVWFKTIANDL